MDMYKSFIYFIIFVKILFFIITTYLLYLKKFHADDEKKIEKVQYWKKIIDFIFIASMALLCIYLFNPYTSKPVVLNFEAKLLLYYFGWILLFTADWSNFFKESVFFKDAQYIIGQ
jgi:hypothetical protein